ncbi:hypothetical protein [Carnobacterium maltaromaticum]|uniref:hypothetical protein n=1 Tax=Carnobacterium maltaromaticum TaxID=2751 RepID=UPI0039BE2433
MNKSKFLNSVMTIFSPSISRFFIFGLLGFTPTFSLFWMTYLSPVYQEISSKTLVKSDIEQVSALFIDGRFIFMFSLSFMLFSFLFFVVSYFLVATFVEIFKCIKLIIFSSGGKN